MYTTKAFEEPSTEVLHQLMREQPLATLVTQSPEGVEANHIPLYLQIEGSGLGVLRGHVAKGNPLWSANPKDAQVLAIFHGPQAYVTPSWYPTKAEHGKVVPTWNYVVAHAYGPMRAIQDADWLMAHLTMLTDHQEEALAAPWHVADAPADYTRKLTRAIVGVEISIQRLIGKCKVSQNQPVQNQEGVYHGLQQTPESAAHAMALMVKKYGSFSA